VIVRLSEIERQHVPAGLDRTPCHFCERDIEVLEALRLYPGPLVWELSKRMEWHPEGMPPEVADAAKRRRVIIRAELTSVACRQIAYLMTQLPDVEVSIIGYDDLRDVLNRSSAEGLGATPEQRIIRRVVSASPVEARQIITAAIAAGKRRTTVQRLSEICGLPTRTMEWRLRSTGLPTARNILGWSVSLHALWRVDALQWPVKRAAREGGFHSQSALANYISRHTGGTPIELKEHGGFAMLLGRFAGLLTTPE
jgi:hypothetical protein